MDVGIRTLAEQDISVLATSQQTQLGATGMTSDGRKFRYVKFGGAATIAPGLICVGPVVTNSAAGFQGLVITTSATTGGNTTAQLALGSTSIVVTLNGTAVTQDQFAEGFIDIIVGGSAADTGHYSYRIKGNTAQTSTTGLVTVYLAEPLRNTTALVAGTDTASLTLSSYSGVAPSVTPGLAIGLTIAPVPNTASVTNYGWVQTAGQCTVLNDSGGTISVGGGFAQSNTASSAGYVKVATASIAPTIGFVKTAITASNAGAAWLNLN